MVTSDSSDPVPEKTDDQSPSMSEQLLHQTEVASSDSTNEERTDDDDDPTEDWYKEEWSEAPVEEPVRSSPEPSPLALSSRKAVQVIWWNDVEKAAKWAFESEMEQCWAQQAWDCFINAGLATYADERERCRVLLRCFTFCHLYRTFLSIAWNPGAAPDEFEYEKWSRDLGLSPFRIGWVVGAEGWPLPEANERNTEFELRSQALRVLADQTRKEVVETLYPGKGEQRSWSSSSVRASDDRTTNVMT